MIYKSTIINAFINARNYKSYLEIGVDRHENFNRVKCELKESVDPNPNTNPTYCMTSDEFWSTNTNRYDIVCIDGLHRGDQVYRDILGSLKFLTKDGLIILHDCLPTEWRNTTIEPVIGAWTGDSWNGFVLYRYESPYRTFTINEDWGCGIIDTKYGKFEDDMKIDYDSLPFKIIKSLDKHCTYLSWDFYNDFKNEILSPIPISEFNKMYEGESILVR